MAPLNSFGWAIHLALIFYCCRLLSCFVFISCLPNQIIFPIGPKKSQTLSRHSINIYWLADWLHSQCSQGFCGRLDENKSNNWLSHRIWAKRVHRDKLICKPPYIDEDRPREKPWKLWNEMSKETEWHHLSGHLRAFRFSAYIPLLCCCPSTVL